MRKTFAFLSLLVIASMALAACGGGAATTTVPAASDATEAPTTDTSGDTVSGFKSKDPTSFINVTFGEPDVLDPALDYETAGSEIIQNVYEGLVFFDGPSASKVVPQLAESFTVSDDGLTYTFTLRQGVKFHNGADLDVNDVLYSYVRGMLQGGYDSPQFLLVEPFFGVGISDVGELVGDGSAAGDPDAMKTQDPAALKAVCEDTYSKFAIDESANTVTMTLAQPWGPFLPTIAQTWGSILDKDWAIENGTWDGSCDTWVNWYAMLAENDTLGEIANGTGAFKLDYWTKGEEIALVRNDNYWREPAKLERVVIKSVNEWGTRFAMAQAGDADFVAVPVENRSQMDALVGETCNWNEAAGQYDCEETDPTQPLRVTLGRPGITRTDIFFNFSAANPDDNSYLGSGKLDGNGIPADFFSDVHIRKAFNYCFDWDVYINDIFKGEAIQGKALVLPGMPGWSEDAPTYSFDLAKCEEEFKLADADKDGIPAGEDPEGDVWTTGFRLSGTYNQGNTTRQKLVEILAANLNETNELFLLESTGLPWPSFLRSVRAKILPLFFVGWQEDIHDPHNWYVPYLQTTYASRQSLPAELKAQFADYINRGVVETDPAKRDVIYQELNQVIYDNPPGIILAIGTSHGFMPRYVKGMVPNPLYGGFYYYPMFKE